MYLKRGNFSDLTASTLFYTMYHSLLSIIVKYGYESRNQECTFALLYYLIEKDKINFDKLLLEKIISLNPRDIHSEKTSVEIREGARPIAQQYFKVKTQCVYIRHSESQSYEVRAEIVAVDRFIDIAVFRIRNVFSLPYAIWRGTPCQVGETIWIYGAPLGVRFSVDKGQVNQVDLDLGMSGGIGWNDQVKMDIAAAPGSSGSGIFDIYGNLVAQEHGVFVYNGNYISGGHLATSGMSIREWLIWSGFAHTVLQPRYRQ